jgi:hypothetical protein
VSSAKRAGNWKTISEENPASAGGSPTVNFLAGADEQPSERAHLGRSFDSDCNRSNNRRFL